MKLEELAKGGVKGDGALNIIRFEASPLRAKEGPCSNLQGVIDEEVKDHSEAGKGGVF